MESQPGADSSPATRRSWRRLHFSTYVVAVLTAALLALAIVPGRFAPRFYYEAALGSSGGSLGGNSACEHGWPWTFLWRDDYWSFGPRVNLWTLNRDVQRFDGLSLACDVSVAIAILCACVAIVEWRRRRRPLFRVSLRELMLAILLIGVGMGIIVREHKNHLKLAACLRELGEDRYWESRLPDWLRECVDAEALNLLEFVRPSGVNVRVPDSDEKLRCLQCVIDQYPDAVSVMAGGDEPSATLDRLGELRGLRHLFVRKVTPAVMRQLPSLTELRWLQLEGDGFFDRQWLVTDEALARVANLCHLEALRIGDSAITDVGIAHLAQLSLLEVLVISGSEVTDDGLAHLRGMKKLRMLSLPGCAVTENGLAAISDLPELQQLGLDCTLIAGSAGELAKMKSLRSLNLDNTLVSDATMEALSGLVELRYLYLGGTLVSDAGFSNLHSLKKLKTLDLDYTPVADLPGLNPITFPALERLDLTQSNLSDERSQEIVATFPNLRLEGYGGVHPRESDPENLRNEKPEMLMWGERTTEDDDLKMLVGLATLRELWLYRSSVTDASLAHVEGLTGLASVDLGKTRVSDVGVAHLRPLVNLEELDLARTLVTERGLSQLGQLWKLEKMGLDPRQVGPQSIHWLRGLPSLNRINVRCHAAPPDIMRELRESLPRVEIEMVWP